MKDDLGTRLGAFFLCPSLKYSTVVLNNAPRRVLVSSIFCNKICMGWCSESGSKVSCRVGIGWPGRVAGPGGCHGLGPSAIRPTAAGEPAAEPAGHQPALARQRRTRRETDRAGVGGFQCRWCAIQFLRCCWKIPFPNVSPSFRQHGQPKNAPRRVPWSVQCVGAIISMALGCGIEKLPPTGYQGVGYRFSSVSVPWRTDRAPPATGRTHHRPGGEARCGWWLLRLT